MKKIYLFLALAAGVLTSCDMDKDPVGSLPDDSALITPYNFQSARTALYSGLKSSIAGSFYNAPEIQCDGFDAVAGFSNKLGEFYRWNFTTQTSDFSTVYGNYQAIIARANYIIDSYNKCDMSNKNVFPDQEDPYSGNPGMPAVNAAKGDAFFLRAYSIFMLSQYFCADYDATTANNENTGVSYRLDYAPSPDASTYPGRKTLAETFMQVKNDLDSAAKYVTEAGAPRSSYISTDAITALRARMALAMDDYETAAREAEILITSGVYTLASNVNEIASMWQNDRADEAILQLPTTSASDLPLATGLIYQPYQTGAVPDYIPTQTLVDLYSDNDYRKQVYFNSVNIVTNTGGVGTVYALNKYLLNGRLYQGLGGAEAAKGCVEPQVFRIAEMYLIAAEAYANMPDGLSTATYYLNELMRNRIADFEDRNYASVEGFMAELRNERTREMVAEGTRLFDIKRWHIDMERGVPQQQDLCMLPGEGTTIMNVPADSPRLTWPIPKHEIDVNKKIVQNPGY